MGILPSSLQESEVAISQIPQPAGWGSFTLAYKYGSGLAFRIPLTEKLGSFIPAYRQRVEAGVRIPNLPVGGFRVLRTLM